MLFLPQGGLAVSVASTVWVGAMAVCALNLCLGWSLTGLIVPGFLIPIFIIQPSSAVINILEGIIAYFITRVIMINLVNRGQIDNLFGRERIFTIIIISIFVRLIFDGWILPTLANYLQHNYNYQFDYYINFNSYGIVIVALIANQFWRIGFLASFIPFTITISITYLLVRYGLMEFSNFRISQLATLYSNINEIFANSAKSYIILVTTTLIALRMSFRYGWDYGGMLVVGFVALQWYSPERVGMTLLEALVIYIIGSLLLKIDYIAKYNIVHAKKILLFFNIGFIYKIFLGDTVLLFFPEERIIEYYGFGYLLSTLIALQIHDDGNLLRAGFMIVWTSFVGFITGSLISLILYFISGSYDKEVIKIIPPQIKDIVQISEKTGYLIGQIEYYKDEMGLSAKLPLVSPTLKDILVIDQFILKPLSDIVLYAKSIDTKLKRQLSKINSYANLFDYELVLFNDLLSHNKFIFLIPKKVEQHAKNWGMYVFRLNSFKDQIIQVPRPFDEVNSLGFAAFLFQRTKAGFLFVGGTYSDVNQDRTADLTRPSSKRSLYNIVNQVFLREHHYQNSVMQIRGYSLSIDSKAKPDADVLVAFADGAIRKEQLSSSAQEIIQIINDQALSYRLVNGDEQTLGYEVGELFLSRYMVQTTNKDLGVIWLSPTLRQNFTDPVDNYSLLSYYNIVDIPTVKDSIGNFLQKSNLIYEWDRPSDLGQLIENYINTNDIVLLKKITELNNLKFKRLILVDDGRDYLAIYDIADNLLGLVSLRKQVEEQTYDIITIAKPRDDLSLKRWINFKRGR